MKCLRSASWLLLAVVFASFAVHPALAAAGQVAAYALDAGSGGVAADSSGNGLNGTLHGTAWTTGKYGNALSFNGAGNYVDLGNPSALQFTGSSTWSAWVFATGIPADDGQIVARSNNTRGWQLKTSPDTGAHRFAVAIENNGASVQRNSTTIRQLNTWYHVAGVYNSASRALDIYVNGVLDNGILDGTVPASIPNASVNAAIGRRSGGSGFYFQGVIDEVRVYNRALAPAEIQADMNTPIGSPVLDTTAPSVVLTAPAAGQLLPSANVSVTASASDNVAVAGVQFLLDGASLGTEDTTAPYGVSWNTAGATNGTHVLSARARDAAGNAASSAPISVTVATDTVPPSVPAGLSATPVSSLQIDLFWNASADDVGVTGYNIFRDGVQVATTTATTFHDDALVPATGYAYSVSAFDAAGNVSAASVSIAALTFPVPQLATPGPLRVLGSNPRYFTDGTGKAVYLAGSHTWSNLLDRGTVSTPPPFDYDGYLAFMAARGFNFMRLWTAAMTNVGNADPNIQIIGGPLPWARTGPGLANDGRPKFDLARFDQAYFDRLRARVIQAGQNGVYVAVQLFDGYNPEFGDSPADGNPFRASNNVNGIDCAGTCSQDASLITPAAWAAERAYIRKVADTLTDLDNVLYEVANEAGDGYSTDWQYDVIAEMKLVEAAKAKRHPVGMTYQYANGGSGDAPLFASDADWISTGAQLPAGTGAKVIVNDTDHAYGWAAMKGDGQAAQRKWVWKNFMNGNGTIFMDPYLVVWSGRNAPGGTTSDPGIGTTLDPYWNVIRNAMRDTASYANRVDLAAMAPTPSCSSTGFCLAHAGTEYLVYQPNSGTFTANLVAGSYAFEWFNPAAGVVAQSGTLSASGGSQTLTPPFSGDAVLYLKKTADTQAPSIPTGLQALSISSSQIGLSWNASSDNVGVAGYKVFRDGVQVATSTAVTYQDGGLAPNTTYAYAVAAFDAAGNASASSASASATTASATGPAFPLAQSANARYLVDQDGAPFPILGRTAWQITSLAPADYRLFIDDTAARGFNAIELALPHSVTEGVNVPFNGNGDLPFLKRLDGANWTGAVSYSNPNVQAPDFTTPSEAFWSYVDGLFAYAESKGLAVLFFPSYVGFNGGDEGWMVEMTANGTSRMQTFGTWVANRYKNQRNIVWMGGGDYGANPSFTSAQSNVENAMLTGMSSVPGQQSTQLSALWGSETVSTDQSTFGPSMTLNGSYSWHGDVNTQSRRAYASTPVTPAFLLEGPYDEEGPDGDSQVILNPNATQPVRRFQWWSWLDTIGGYFSGNGSVWPFIAPHWQNHLNSVGTQDMTRLNAFIAAHEWWQLVPTGSNGMRNLITAGGSSPSQANYVAAAATPSGTLLVAYVPPAHTGSITVDMTAMSGLSQARWFDPTSGTYVAIPGSPFANVGTRPFTPPGSNSGGQTDWVLVLEPAATGPDTQPPSVPTGLTGTAISSSQIHLSWAPATDNVGVAGYGIYRDGIQVATSTVATYQDTGLAANASYAYAVDAFDAAGNRSARSAPIDVATPAQGIAAPTFVQSRSQNKASGTTNSLAFAAPVGAGNAIVVYVQTDTPAPATVTDSQGNVFQRALSTPWANNTWGAQVFYAANASGGADTITATFASPITSFGLIYIQEYAGVDPLNPLDAAAAAQGSGASLNSGTLATTSPNDLVFGAAGSEMNVTGAGPSFAVRNSTFGNMIEDRVAAAPGSYALTGTHDASFWVAQAIALRGR